MKIKVVLASVAVVAIAVVALSFTSAKKFAPTSYRFDPTSNMREIATGQPLSINQTDLVTQAKWNNSLPTVNYATTGSYLRAIQFEFESNSDGAGDGQLSLQEAIDAVDDYYSNHSFTLPNDGTAIRITGAGSPGFTDVVIKRSNDNTN